MAFDEFNVGDIVRLKGVGDCPPMTVDWVEERRIGCVWFTTTREFQREEFYAESLELCPLDYILRYWGGHGWSPVTMDES